MRNLLNKRDKKRAKERKSARDILMRHKEKYKNYGTRRVWREHPTRSCANEKIEYLVEANSRHKFMGRSTFRNDNQASTRAAVNRSL